MAAALKSSWAASRSKNSYAGDPQVRGALQKVLDSIHSDGECRRVVAAFVEAGH